MSKIALAAAALAASVVSMGQISGAHAADAPKAVAKAAAPAGAALTGPLVKGVCLLSQEAVLGNAKVALAVDARLKQLMAQAQAEVDASRGPIEADAKALQADAAKTPAPPPADLDKRRAALQVRAQALQTLADQRNREIEATRQKQLARVSAEMQPALAAAYGAHGCGLLLNRNSVLAGNMSDDLTGDVVKGLDAKITTLAFDREVLPPQASK